jgi:hypothetical protein
MKSLFELLNAIRLRPEMYVGGDRSQRGAQLQHLEFLLHGYALAVEVHHLDEGVKDFPREFAEYLQHTYGWSAAAGPVAAIRDATSDDDEAWELFWSLVQDFKTTVKRPD